MRALWAKDRPWILLLVAGGVVALTAAIGDGGFFRSLALEDGHSSTEFHTAWICGLALGLVAASFEHVLGVRDYLRQRPISAEQLFFHRVRVMLVVLGSWLIATPLVGWLWMVIFEAFAGISLAAVLSIQAFMSCAVSAAAIGFFAGMLPVSWWLRLVAGGAVFLTAFSAIDGLARLESGYYSIGVFVGLHLLSAALFGALAWSVRAATADADRPWPRGVRLGVGSALILALAAVATGGLSEAEKSASWSLYLEYPAVVEHEGRCRLIDRRSRWERGGTRFVDGDHVATGETAPRDATRDVNHGWQVPERYELGFDSPRWHASLERRRCRGTLIYLTWDGRVWLRSVESPRSAMRETGKGPDRAPFGARARTYGGHYDGSWVIVWEPDEQAAWRFDPARSYFVPIELPGGDRVTEVDWVHPALELIGGSPREHRLALRGENGVYVPQGDELVRVTEAREAARPGSDRDEDIMGLVRGGPIVATVEVPADGDRPGFTHELRPRTVFEYGYAAAIVLLAAAQPPAANLFGRPIGVTLLSIAFGLLSAWLAARRLRRIGAPAGVRRYWIAFSALLGPAALVLSVFLERARAWAARSAPAAEPPRIFTPLSALEPTS